TNAGGASPPSTAMASTPDRYTPPTLSQELLRGVPFTAAERVGKKYTDRFDRWDELEKKKKSRDPNMCRGLYRLPGGVLFWESKMAVDADGATTKSVLDSSSGSQVKTSYCFNDKKRTPVNAEVV